MRRVLTVALLLFSTLICTSFSDNSYALIVDHTCSQVAFIYARGSGEGLESDNFRDIKKKMESRLEGVQVHIYQLGTEEYDNHKYPAVDIGQWWNGNAIGAKVSGGYGNDYGKSVDAGVGELYGYVTQRHAKCPNEYIVLGGYSQGAQVVGQTLGKFSPPVKDKIIFTALFGDPKIYLPEGLAHLGQKSPPACQGKELSPWRRYIGDCRLYEGSLGRRVDYTPDALRDATGTWCVKDDFVCGTSKNVFKNSGHGNYFIANGSADAAALEIASRLKPKLPDSQNEIDDSTHADAVKKVGEDVVFVLDTTRSMQYKIDSTKQFIRQSVQKIREMNGRVGLAVYRDAGDEYTSKVLTDLDGNTTNLLEELDAVRADGGGDTPEAALHGLTTAFDAMSWRDGADKSTILLTDAEYHSPDSVDGTTLDKVVKRSLEIDPVNVYPVVSENLKAAYDTLASRTSGQVIVDYGNTVDALTTALSRVAARPSPQLKMGEYSADVGHEVVFDASDTTVFDATLTNFEWDFDGDGIFDAASPLPYISHVYKTQFDGFMQVRVTASNGTVASMSAPVKIGVSQSMPTPATPGDFRVASSTATSATLTWRASGEEDWLLYMNDANLGKIQSGQATVEVTDIDRIEEVVFRLVPVAGDGTVGQGANAVLAAYSSSPTPNPPSSSSPLNLICNLISFLFKKLTILFRF